MFDLRLKTRPSHYDEYGQPCYPTAQEKGLSEFQINQLIAAALAEGYTGAVAKILLKLIKKEILIASGSRKVDMLEIGGGNGHFFDLVEEYTSTYVNVEPGYPVLDEQGLDRLRNPKYQSIRCSAEEIPLHDGSVDVIISIASFDHIPNYQAALAEVSRLLRSGGIFILTINNRGSWWKILLSRTDYLKRREVEISREHYIQWSLSECEARLSEYLPVINIHSTTFFPYVPKLWRYLLHCFDFFGNSLLSRYGANIIAVCRKPNDSLLFPENSYGVAQNK
jgi:ubiquinone/menaquinone biosynthesis C-methylase UbiE